MITADDARKISAGTISDESAAHLMEEIEAIIRIAASKGKSSIQVTCSGMTDAEEAYARTKLKELGFSITEIGFTICW